MKISLIAILIFLISCNSKRRSESSQIMDTTYIPISPNNSSFDTTEALPHPRLNSKSVIDNPEIKKLYGPNFKADNEIEILEKKVAYNSDFKPTLNLTIKNNMTINLVAFEIIVNPNDKTTKCPTESIKRKITLLPNESILIKQDLSMINDKCNLDETSVILGDCIFSNGMKISMSDFFRNYDGY